MLPPMPVTESETELPASETVAPPGTLEPGSEPVREEPLPVGGRGRRGGYLALLTGRRGVAARSSSPSSCTSSPMSFPVGMCMTVICRLEPVHSVVR